MKRNLFNSIQLLKPKKNVFDLSHDVKMSGKLGYLYPVCNEEVVPGDKFSIGCESLVKFAPMIAPVMHRYDVYIHYFFVPYRILWDGWQYYIPGDATYGPHPYVTWSQDISGANTLGNYLGLPNMGSGNEIDVSAFPFAAYQCIYNEFYRDQNLVPEVNYVLATGDNTAASNMRVLRRRAWEHDYFTASLPFAQRGDAVELPLGTFNDVEVGINGNGEPTLQFELRENGGSTILSSDVQDSTLPNDGKVYAKTSDLGAQSALINDVRRAFRLQEWLERNARGGVRYVENVLAHFGVKSSDARLQRPEYITGMKTPVVVSEVISTFQEQSSLDSPPQGNMSGHAVSVGGGKYGNYFVEEHGIIMGLLSVMPKTAYQDGIARKWRKIADPTEYYWPSFANLGEQPVENSEVYADHTTPEGVFGYVPRYAEYKFANSRVAGEFTENLNFWHHGRIFTSSPALNQAFIECNPSTRVFAVEDLTADHLYCHVLNKIKAIRPMPKFGTPTI